MQKLRIPTKAKQKTLQDSVILVYWNEMGDPLVDYASKGIDEKLWEGAEIKAIRQKVKMNYVMKRAIEMWVKGEIE